MSIRMDNTAKDLLPVGNSIVLLFETIPVEVELQEEDEKSGNMKTVTQTQIHHRAKIHAIGDEYEGTLKKGDWVLFDGTDMISIDLESPNDKNVLRKFGICRPISILAVYKV